MSTATTETRTFTAPVSLSELRKAIGWTRERLNSVRKTQAYAPYLAAGFESTPAGVVVSPDAANRLVQICRMIEDGGKAPEIVAAFQGSEGPPAPVGTGPVGVRDAVGTACLTGGNEGGSLPVGEAVGTPEGDKAPELAHLRELVSLQGSNLTDLRRELDRAGEREREAARTLAGERQTWQEREGRLLDALTREQEGMMALTKALAAGDMARLVEVARGRGIPTHGLETVLEAAQRPTSGAGEAKTPEEGQRRPWWRVWGRAAAL